MLLHLIYVGIGLLIILIGSIWYTTREPAGDLDMYHDRVFTSYSEDEWADELHRMNVEDFTLWLATATNNDVDDWLARGKLSRPEWVHA